MCVMAVHISEKVKLLRRSRQTVIRKLRQLRDDYRDANVQNIDEGAASNKSSSLTPGMALRGNWQ
jgi:hypothetical protein